MSRNFEDYVNCPRCNHPNKGPGGLWVDHPCERCEYPKGHPSYASLMRKAGISRKRLRG